MQTLLADLSGQIASIRSSGTYKPERIISSPQGALIHAEKRQVLNFCSNNYLGMANRPDVIQAAEVAMDSRGYGLASVRFICGTQDVHKELERRLTEFYNRDEAVLFTSCFDANGALFEALLDEKDAVFSDELNHASIIDGMRLCRAKKFRYKHLDVKDLEGLLKQHAGARHKLIASDGVFSMDGDLAPLPGMVELATKYGALIFLDDSHATGVMGRNGRGTGEHYDLEHEVDIINSTLGKALGGGVGGYTIADERVAEMIRQKGRPYLFSNSLAPAMVGASIQVLDTLPKEIGALLKRLRNNTRIFREAIVGAGLKVLGHKDCPIVPIMIGDAKLTNEIAEEMMQQGVYVIGFSYPVVPKGQARIRVQLSAAHEERDVEEAVRAFVQVGRQKGIIV